MRPDWLREARLVNEARLTRDKVNEARLTRDKVNEAGLVIR